MTEPPADRPPEDPGDEPQEGYPPDSPDAEPRPTRTTWSASIGGLEMIRGEVGRAAFDRLKADSRQLQPRRQAAPKPQTFDERVNEVILGDRQQKVRLKRHLAYGAFTAVAVQLVVANLAFYLYGFTSGWDQVESEVMIAWLSATVLETVGILAIIARNLFPSGESSE